MLMNTLFVKYNIIIFTKLSVLGVEIRFIPKFRGPGVNPLLPDVVSLGFHQSATSPTLIRTLERSQPKFVLRVTGDCDA